MKRIPKKIPKPNIENEIDKLEFIFTECFPGWGFSEDFRLSVKRFLQALGFKSVVSALEIACDKMEDELEALKYFCGICWFRIRELPSYE